MARNPAQSDAKLDELADRVDSIAKMVDALIAHLENPNWEAFVPKQANIDADRSAGVLNPKGR